MTTAAPPLLVRRLSHAQLVAVDVALAVAVAMLCWYAALESPTAPLGGWREPMWVSLLTGILLAAPVAVRRRRPVLGSVVTSGLAALSVASAVIPDYAGSAPIVAVGLGLYTVGATVEAGRSAAVACGCAGAIAAAFLFAARSLFEASFATLVLCACWAIGRTVRERRAYATYIAEAATARAVGEERMRIAREVHDIVAHTMSVIAVKATIADHLADEHPQEMREALRVIGSTSRGALAELRVALGVLRTDVPLAPTPGMDDLAGLVEIAEAAGMTVDLDVRGDAEVPDGMAQAVFRIVQESLTNVVKHAEGATHCAVSIHISPVEVRIEAVDDGHPVPARAVDAGTATATAGQGLIGMRERVALFGGRFAAGPRQPHGWSVSATLRCEGGAGVE